MLNKKLKCICCKKYKDKYKFSYNIKVEKKYRKKCIDCFCHDKSVIRNKNRRKKRELLNNIKEEKGCFNCGNKDFRVLDFHHKNNNNKIIKLSKAVNDFSIKRILKEVEKCEVYCVNCHRIHHWKKIILTNSI